MNCYKSGGCGVYENRSCAECPASKPEYLNKKVKKYKYEFEVNEDFEPGNCYECHLSYIDWDDPAGEPYCVLHAEYGECPLEKVEV